MKKKGQATDSNASPLPLGLIGKEMQASPGRDTTEHPPHSEFDLAHYALLGLLERNKTFRKELVDRIIERYPATNRQMVEKLVKPARDYILRHILPDIEMLVLYPDALDEILMKRYGPCEPRVLDAEEFARVVPFYVMDLKLGRHKRRKGKAINNLSLEARLSGADTNRRLAAADQEKLDEALLHHINAVKKPEQMWSTIKINHFKAEVFRKAKNDRLIAAKDRKIKSRINALVVRLREEEKKQ